MVAEGVFKIGRHKLRNWKRQGVLCSKQPKTLVLLATLLEELLD